jgi:quercetin dioxygenase-like cupin family protein
MDTVNLQDLAAEYLEQAGATSSGRHSHTLIGGQGHALRQTLMALKAGQGLADHESPGEATVQVITGHISITTASSVVHLRAGDLVEVPGELHSVQSLEDSAMLLTVLVPQAH